jgi:hypothetical protein
MPSGKKTYHLLSEKSRAQVGEEAWVKDSEFLAPDNAVKVLRKEEVRGTTYALVSIIGMVHGNGMDSAGNIVTKEWKDIRTHSWILENGKWRLLSFPKTSEEVNRAFNNGDYAAAKAKAEEWLTLDPFSISAYGNLIFAIARGGRTLPKEGARSVHDIVRAVLAVNPEDTRANFIAVSYTEDRAIAKSLLARLKETTYNTTAAINVAQKYGDPRARLAFLKEQDRDAGLDFMKAITFAELKRWGEFREIALNKSFIESMKNFLDVQDTSQAAGTSAELGLCFIGADDRANARLWFEYGVSKDPNNPKIRRLGRALER